MTGALAHAPTATAGCGAHALDAAAIEDYRRDGYLSPIDVCPPEEMAAHLARLEAIEAGRAGRLPPSLNVKAHLVLPWLWDLVMDPRIVDPVADLLGPDILCWASSFFAKDPGAPHHVPWHQDATYWGLSEPRALTAWVAFTASVPENGCMRVVPGSHAVQLAHGDTFDAANMLAGREEILVEVDESAAVDIVLRPGQMSLHHLLLIHGSKPNRAGFRRVGFAIRYIAGDLVQTGDGPRGTATLVRGRDHGHYDLEARPRADFDPEALVRQRDILRRWMGNVFSRTAPTRARPAEPARRTDLSTDPTA